jgi:hypothetical protein
MMILTVEECDYSEVHSGRTKALQVNEKLNVLTFIKNNFVLTFISGTGKSRDASSAGFPRRQYV